MRSIRQRLFKRSLFLSLRGCFRWLSLVSALLLVLLAGSTAAVGSGSREPPYTAFPQSTATINGNPLRIVVSSKSNIQVYYAGIDLGQFYHPNQSEANHGIFLWVNNKTYGPVSANYNFTEVSQSGPTGDGSAASPWVVTTVLAAGSTGIRVNQRVTYVNGQPYFRLDSQITNTGSASSTVTYFHAGDLYLEGSDRGYGYYNSSTGGVGGYNSSRNWYVVLQPETPATKYEEDHYSTIWNHITSGNGPGSGFDNSINSSLVDNGAGLQWSDIALSSGQSRTISSWVSFGTAPVSVPTYSVSGRVTDSGGSSIQGATVSTNSGASATSDGNGNYTLSGLTAGTYVLTPSKSGYSFTPPPRTVSVPPSRTGQDFTGALVGTTGTVRVIHNDNPVEGAQVFLGDSQNGRLMGVTSAQGTLVVSGLRVGDKLVARKLITEVATAKANHSQGSTQNWGYRVYITSLDIPTLDEPQPREVSDPTGTTTLTLKTNNALIGFNIVASVEWDANAAYLEELKRGFAEASKFLYDATDGQMLFEQVTIYDNAQLWGSADYLFYANNNVRPWVFQPFGDILRASSTWARPHFGRWLGGYTWYSREGYSALVHEFGHYGLALYDSYKRVWLLFTVDGGTCAPAGVRDDGFQELATYATLMDHAWRASEFSMRGVKDLWFPECEDTAQYSKYGKSDWETFTDSPANLRGDQVTYSDTANPPRWQLKRPVPPNGAVRGPALIPVAAWSTQMIGVDANTGTCAASPAFKAVDWRGQGISGARVVLIKGNRNIDQGETDAAGDIAVLGAANGDTIHALFRFDESGSERVSCGASLSPQAEPSTLIRVQPPAFALGLSVWPASGPNRAIVSVRSSVGLAVEPTVNVHQTGAVARTPVAMAYYGGPGTYSGGAVLDGNLPASGTVEVSATDNGGRTVRSFASFTLVSVSRGTDALIISGDGQAELQILANALSGDTELSIADNRSTGPPPSSLEVLSGPYMIEARAGIGLSGGAGLAVRYLDMGGTLSRADLSTALLYRWNGAVWEAMASTHNQSQGVVSATIGQLGTYAVMAERRYRAYLPVQMNAAILPAGGQGGLVWWNRFGVPRSRINYGAARATNGKVYVIGGLDSGVTPSPSVEEYDPASNTWSSRAPMPTARHSLAVAAASNGRIYAIGGAVEEYDPATNSWRSRSSAPYGAYLSAVGATNGKIYAVRNQGESAALDQYDPATDSWTGLGAVPTDQWYPGAAAASNGRIYLIGGHNNQGYVLSTVVEYDPTTNSWRGRAPMPTARTHLSVAAASNGRVYAVGGHGGQMNGYTVYATTEEYDPATDAWIGRAPMPTARWRLRVVAATDTKLWAMGGCVTAPCSQEVTTVDEAFLR